MVGITKDINYTLTNLSQCQRYLYERLDRAGDEGNDEMILGIMEIKKILWKVQSDIEQMVEGANNG